MPDNSSTGRALRLVYWVFPSALCLWLYWNGFRAWFQQDDFAWLGLDLTVNDLSTFLRATFAPMAQGTIRPLSERLFFMGFVNLFGLDPLPFRVVIFATQFANLVLLTKIVNRLTGLRAAGFAAAVLWVVNQALALPLSWASAFNQVLCAFFLLLAFWLFLKERYWLQFAVFVLGFGALEINVVYPVLLVLYCLCCDRRRLLSTLPMFAVSVVYAVMHRSVAPAVVSDIYRMYFDGALPRTLWKYVQWALGSTNVAVKVTDVVIWPFYLGQAAAGIGLLVTVGWLIRQRQWLGLFMAGWFFAVLAPVLPLKNHVSEYYLLIPIIGLAMLGGWGVALALRSGNCAVAAIAVVGALLYAAPAAWGAWKITQFNYARSLQSKNLLQSLAYAHKLYPDKILLLHGVSGDLFWNGVRGRPCRMFGLSELYLTAETEPAIVKPAGFESLSSYFLSERAALDALIKDRAMVYEVAADGRLKNITMAYGRRLVDRAQPQLSPYVALGERAFAAQLGQGWHRIEEGGFRWMSKEASVQIRGPRGANARIEVTGHCPESPLREGPVRLSVSANGRLLGQSALEPGHGFRVEYPLDAELARASEIRVGLEVDRILKNPPDPRELGLVISSIAVVE